MEDQAFYLAVKVLTEAGKASYRAADRRVAQYAVAHDMSKADAWSLLRAEARSRGDNSITQAAAWVETHPVAAQLALAPLGPLGAAVFTGGAWVRNRKTRGL